MCVHMHPNCMIARACECIEARAKNGDFDSGIVVYDDKGQLSDEAALLKMVNLQIGTYVTRPGFILQSLFVHVWL